METFIQQYKTGKVTVEQIDDFIDQWHEGNSTLSLSEFLGMTKEEYQRWLTNPNDLPSISGC